MEKVRFEKLDQLDYYVNERYKSLRTNIVFCGSEIKVIMLTSCTPNEGKSSIAFELARSFAENGNEVILVDADLRKSVLVGRYKTGAVDTGLSNYLSGQNNAMQIIKQTNIEHMDIIFSGPIPPNPAELLGHKRFEELLLHLKETYDYVIVDTPPVGSVIDGVIVAPRCDGAIMIIENNAISYRFALDVKKQLEKSGCRILGAILNKVPIEKNGKHYGRYYGEYYGEHKVQRSTEKGSS